MNYLIQRVEYQIWAEWVKSEWAKSATHMTLTSVPQLISNNSELTQINLQFYEKWPMHIVSYSIMIFIWNFARAMS